MGCLIYYLYLIPTIILIATGLIYRLSGRGFSEYTARLQSKVKTIEKLSNMVFTKDMLTLFLQNSSVNTSMFFTQREYAEEYGEEEQDSAGDVPLMSMKDMTKLETSLNNALQPSRDMERVNNNTSLVRKLMIIYGVLVAAIEYAVVTVTQFAFADNLILQLDGIVFGITIIFSAVFLLIIIDLFKTSSKISSAYDNVETNYASKGKPLTAPESE